MSIRSLLGLDRRPKVLSDKTIVEIRPMTVEQSVLIEQHFEKMADTFVDTDFKGLEVQAAFFAKHAHEYASIIAAAIDTDVEVVKKMPRKDADEIWADLFRINSDFFNGLLRQAAIRKAKSALKSGTRPG